MYRHMELVDLSSPSLQAKAKKTPVMLEVLQLFSYETPASIRIVNMDFHRLQEALPENEAKILRMSGYSYRVQVHGEIFSPYSSGRAKLEGYVNHLESLDYFKGLEVTRFNEDADTRTISFVISALI